MGCYPAFDSATCISKTRFMTWSQTSFAGTSSKKYTRQLIDKFPTIVAPDQPLSPEQHKAAREKLTLLSGVQYIGETLEAFSIAAHNAIWKHSEIELHRHEVAREGAHRVPDGRAWRHDLPAERRRHRLQQYEARPRGSAPSTMRHGRPSPRAATTASAPAAQVGIAPTPRQPRTPSRMNDR